jgi:hypothetical protein
MSTDPAENRLGTTYDQHGNQLTPTPPKINLHNADAIRRELGAVYRDMRSGRIDPADGTKLAYVLDRIREAYETSVLEERISLLEGLKNGNN